MFDFNYSPTNRNPIVTKYTTQKGTVSTQSSCFPGISFLDTGLQHASVTFACNNETDCSFIYDLRFSCSNGKRIPINYNTHTHTHTQYRMG